MTDTEADTGTTDSSLLGGIVIQEPGAPVWYKRPWVLWTAAVLAVVAASVIIDLPGRTTTGEDTAAQTSLVNEINGDVSGCVFAVRETFSIYQDMKAGALTPSDRSHAPKMLGDDQTACSFTSNAIFNLSSVEVPGSPAGKQIQQLVGADTLWATSDALAAIEDIQALYANQARAGTIADLSKQQKSLAEDRALAIGHVAAADKILGAKLPMPNLPVLPHLAGTPG
jgi:hypothetical protein